MLQAKFSIDELQAQFLNNFKAYGFKDKSSMLRTAIEHFKKEMKDGLGLRLTHVNQHIILSKGALLIFSEQDESRVDPFAICKKIFYRTFFNLRG